ncbi:hypothetical protein MBANPS3_011387 [Mucor bainieri]
MKFSFSLALLACTAICVQAAATPVRASSTCISGSSGLGKGNGFNGYCCKTSDDCWQSCKSGVCNGPSAPNQTTNTSKPTESVMCFPGVQGQGDGNGGYGCKNGMCNQPR